MVFLAKFLHRNLKGYRFLVILAILVAFAQVGSDLLAAMPLKFIPSKVNNPGSDPACTFPFLDPVLSFFLGWQTCLEQDLLQSREIGSRILAKAQLLATGLPPRGELLTHGVPRLRIFQRQCAR